MCTHSHTVVALFSLLSHNHIIKKNLALSATLFHMSFHSHIFLLSFLIHTISLLHFFLTFYTIIDILFCSIYSLKHFFMQHSATCHLSFSIYKKTKHKENININIKVKYCLNWSMNNCITIIYFNTCPLWELSKCPSWERVQYWSLWVLWDHRVLQSSKVEMDWFHHCCSELEHLCMCALWRCSLCPGEFLLWNQRAA